MSSPSGGRRQLDNESEKDDNNENSSDDEDAQLDLSSRSDHAEDNKKKQSYNLRSKGQSSPPSTPGSVSPSPLSKSKIYPDLSSFQDSELSPSDKIDYRNTSASKSPSLNTNNSSTNYEAEDNEPPSSNDYNVLAVVAVLFAIVLVYLFIPGRTESFPTIVSFNKYVNDIDTLSQQLPNQKRRLWTTIKASARHILNETQSDYPSVILMASDVHAGDTALCLARLITSRFESASYKSSDSSIADIAQFKDLPHVEQKKALDESLNKLLRGHKSVIVNNLQLLSPEAALLLHAYCDNDNAPYKDVMIVLLFYTDASIQLDPDRPNSFEAYLEEQWSKELHIDKVSAIMSRVANNIVVVTKESKAAVASVCTNV